MSLTFSEKALIAIVTLLLSFYSGQMSRPIPQGQFCLAPSSSTPLINSHDSDSL
jgi:hypothetical protein